MRDTVDPDILKISDVPDVPASSQDATSYTPEETCPEVEVLSWVLAFVLPRGNFSFRLIVHFSSS